MATSRSSAGLRTETFGANDDRRRGPQSSEPRQRPSQAGARLERLCMPPVSQ
ncbi:hypothetical protein CABS01_05166 [Colletotrichum abscissum]|uniref:uncharacterized protein n=1 Tax=Colletotrichum abscissum TaxID=1671311 RepID=UPI0027D75134|nr:uncharacterized protein CABS01_05166 [Colletotrichum abscissum]KAK1523545.1 hypothetical protein CABS01_05166 [Colletotrichum abscissum]